MRKLILGLVIAAFAAATVPAAYAQDPGPHPPHHRHHHHRHHHHRHLPPPPPR